MADIYNDEGTLDYAKAAALVRSGDGLSTGPIFEAKMARVQAAALLDIAVSLNGLLTAVATGGAWLEEDETDDAPDVPSGERRTVDDPDDGDDERETDLDLDIGDRVTAEGAGAGVIKALGESEDAAWAEVSWDVDEGEDERVTRAWVSQLEREQIAEPDEAEADALCGAVDDMGGAGPCIKEAGHGGRKHLDLAGRKWDIA